MEPTKKKIKKEGGSSAGAMVKIEPPPTPQIKLEAGASGANLKSSAANAARAQDSWMKLEKDKQIAKARQKPLPALIHLVLTHLRETRKAETPAEIKAATEADIDNNKDLCEALKSNMKIHFEDGRFSYKSRHTVINRDDVLRLLARNPDGIVVDELLDSYPGIEKDIEMLQETREVYAILNTETKSKTLYYAHADVYADVLRIDDDVKQLWRDVQLPPPIDLEKAMKDAKLTLMKQDEAVIEGKKKKERKKRERRIKLTNTHLSEVGIDLSKDYVPQGPSKSTGSISVQSVKR